MNTQQLKRAGGLILACSALSMFYACGEDDTASSSDELFSAEASIAALRGSSAEAQAAAQACFDAFKTCETSATAGATSCRDQLKACLPDAPPPGCGGGRGGRADGGTKPDAGVASASARGDSGRPARDGDADDDRRSARDGAVAKLGDGGAPWQGFGERGRGDDDDERADEGRGKCGGFDFPRGALGGCRDQATESMRRGMGCDGARAQHRGCVSRSFDDALAKLCSKASAICGQPGAPADVCARITSACAAAPQSDAGLSADAGR
jgi:hypothetical protein